MNNRHISERRKTSISYFKLALFEQLSKVIYLKKAAGWLPENMRLFS